MKRRLKPAPWWAAAVLAVAVVALVGLVALGTQGLPGSETRPPPFLINVDLRLVFRIIMGLVAVLVVLIVVVLLLPGGPPVKLPERKKSSPLALLAAVALVFAIMLLLENSAVQNEQEAGQAGAGETASTGDPAQPQESGSHWGLIILGGAVLLVVWGVSVASRSPAERHETSDSSGPMLVTEAIDEVLIELEESDDPRHVVIKAYARMEGALTNAGLPRRASEAPLEYLTRSLRRLLVSRQAVARLTRLFEVARFSDHEVPPEMGREAIAAFNEIRDELNVVSP